MREETLREALLQGSEHESAELFNEVLRGCVRAGLLATLAEEAELLCGPKYRPDPESEYRRAGSERGQVYIDGKREEILRPRVREKEGGEVPLASYQAARSPRRIYDEVVGALNEGLAIRGASRCRGPKNLSRSMASRMWMEKSREQLAELRNRDLGEQDWLALWLDGVRLSEGLWVIVAVGMTCEGDKQVLDFEQGSSENSSSCSDLLERLKQRGVDQVRGRRLLICRDGSKALARAVEKHWTDAHQQECLVHLQRELRRKVSRRCRADLDRLLKNFRDSQGKEAGEEAFDEMLDYVSKCNAAAGVSLQLRRDTLLTFHRLEVPSTLNGTFLNTNIVENVIRNWREATGNVKRWNEKGDMVSRWMSSGLLWAESGFRKVRGHQDLPLLKLALAEDGAARPEPSQAVISLTTPAERDVDAEEEKSIETSTQNETITPTDRQQF